MPTIPPPPANPTMHREADVFGPNGKERWLEEARMKALGVGVSRVDLDATDPGTPGALAERDPNADGDFIIPWYDPRFEAMYGHGANRNPSIDRALQRRLRAPTVHALRHGGKEAYTPAAMDARIAASPRDADRPRAPRAERWTIATPRWPGGRRDAPHASIGSRASATGDTRTRWETRRSSPRLSSTSTTSSTTRTTREGRNVRRNVHR